jgi:hypothetical protein
MLQDTHLTLQLPLPLHQSAVLFLYSLLLFLRSSACCFPLILSRLNSLLLSLQSEVQWHVQSFPMFTKPETLQYFT